MRVNVGNFFVQEQDAQIDMTMLKNKEIGDQNERSKNQRKLEEL